MKSNLKKFELFFNSYSETLKKKLNEIEISNLYSAVKIIEKTIIKKKFYLYMWKWWISSNSKSLYM